MEQEFEIVEAGALEAIERASIDVQIATAKRYPIHNSKNLSKVKEDMLSLACLDEETAATCFYTLPRGGKTIQGPSVRCAEIAIACYGNMRSQARVIEVVTSGDNPHVAVQAVSHDLEKNVAISIEKRRRIVGKKDWNTGGHKPIDEDDINLAVNACTAIAFRDAVFKVIPMALIKPVYEAAKKLAVGEVKSLAEKRNTVVARLKQMGVTEDRILAVVNCRKVDDIGQDELGVLIGLGTALKDGDTTLEDAFPQVKTGEDAGLGTEGLKAKLGRKPGSKNKPKDETADPTQAPATPVTPETPPVDATAAPVNQVLDPAKALSKARSDLGMRLMRLANDGHKLMRDEQQDVIVADSDDPDNDRVAKASLACLTTKPLMSLTAADCVSINRDITELTRNL
jgi:hypothetical protein